MDKFILGGYEFSSRLLTGTGKFRNKEEIKPMLEESGSEMITMALRRVNLENREDNILSYIPKSTKLLPNTSGARTAEEAIKIAKIARASSGSDFIKIEVISDMKYLMPDNEETIKATKVLSDMGFLVLPYVTPDLMTAVKLEKAGAKAIMPLGSPIGSNQGILSEELIKMIIDTVEIPVIVDAGLGTPSHATRAMEIGASAVLVNTAIATAKDPVKMGKAFAKGVEAGRTAYLLNLPTKTKIGSASSPLTGFLYS